MRDAVRLRQHRNGIRKTAVRRRDGGVGGTFTWPYGVSPMTLTLRQTGAEVTGDIATIGTAGEVSRATDPFREP